MTEADGCPEYDLSCIEVYNAYDKSRLGKFMQQSLAQVLLKDGASRCGDRRLLQAL